MSDDRLVSTKELESLFGCRRTKVWKLAKDGHITPIRLGARMTRFSLKQAQELAAKGI
jgi:predicted DNA-binding transcriptional regulator AlpA